MSRNSGIIFNSFSVRLVSDRIRFRPDFHQHDDQRESINPTKTLSKHSAKSGGVPRCASVFEIFGNCIFLRNISLLECNTSLRLETIFSSRDNFNGNRSRKFITNTCGSFFRGDNRLCESPPSPSLILEIFLVEVSREEG